MAWWLYSIVFLRILRAGDAARGFARGLSYEEMLKTPLSAEDLQGCSYEVVMLDTRNLTDEPAFMGSLVPDQYWSLTAVLNYAYAKEFGYKFTYVHLDEHDMLPQFNVAWHRVFYFAERLRHATQAKANGGCSWLLYLDSDAFVLDFTTQLKDFIAKMAHEYKISNDVGAIFAQEQVCPPEMPFTWHAVNAGVYLLREGKQSSNLFNIWQGAASDDTELMNKWPAEQGVLTELEFPGKYYTKLGKKHASLKKHEAISDMVALVNMTEMNSPWGRFVEHVWSGPGSEKRGTDFTAQLAAINAADPKRFESLLKEARTHVVSWKPEAVA